MSNKSQDSLYKYRSFVRRSLEVFINKELYFSDYEQFNDPFDCAIKISQSFDDSCVDRLHNAFIENCGPPKDSKIMKTQIRRMQKNINKDSVHVSNKILELQKQLGVFSLSADAENILMWSHYADNHRGFCIEFVNIEENIGFKPVKVQYPKEYPMLNFVNDVVESIFQNRSSKIESMVHAITTKSELWEYEQEYRIFSGNKKGLIPFPEKMVQSVIFGWKTDESQIKTIIHLLNNDNWSHVNFKKAIPIENEFAIKIVDLKNTMKKFERIENLNVLSY